jgi:mono/diheme cytochrome c family protein
MTLGMVIAGGVLVLVGGLSTTPAGAADIFKEKCASCHGETGHADTAAGKAMKVPALASDAKVAAMSQADIVAAIKANPKHAAMLKKLSDDDIAAAAARVKEIAATK